MAFHSAAGDWSANERVTAHMTIPTLFGYLAGRAHQGPCLWRSVHGLVDLLVKGVIDVGQRDLGASVLASRGDTLLRGLISALAL